MITEAQRDYLNQNRNEKSSSWFKGRATSLFIGYFHSYVKERKSKKNYIRLSKKAIFEQVVEDSLETIKISDDTCRHNLLKNQPVILVISKKSKEVIKIKPLPFAGKE